MNIDPVCGAKLKERDPQHASVVEGKIYYFCSLDCKKEFDGQQKFIAEQLADVKNRCW